MARHIARLSHVTLHVTFHVGEVATVVDQAGIHGQGNSDHSCARADCTPYFVDLYPLLQSFVPLIAVIRTPYFVKSHPLLQLFAPGVLTGRTATILVRGYRHQLR